MQERRWRPKFWNPFAENKSSFRAFFRGFFREMPLHMWSTAHVTKILEYAAARPKYFGFPDGQLCIVNPILLTKNLRSRQQGVTVFGSERGCKSIVVPLSCTGAPFDEYDCRLIEPLFKKNPSVEYIFLSSDCMPMVNQLVPVLSQLRHVKTLALPGWSDAIAIHKIVMACKHCEIVDAMSLESKEINWVNEASVQALCALIEMHPKLRAVLATRFYLAHWYAATLHSRCRFNVALMMDTCESGGLQWFFWYAVVFMLLIYGTAALRKMMPFEEYTCYVVQSLLLALLVVIGIARDHLRRRTVGRLWLHATKYVVLGLRRVAVRKLK